MSLQQINYTQIRGGQVNVLDVGIVPNDNTKRAANTAILLATLAKTESYGIEFPQGNDTYYFDAFTIPDKVIYMTGHTSIRGDSGTILDILGDAVTNVAIDTLTASQNSRFSRLENLIITVPLTATAIKVNNGGLMLNQIWIVQANIGLHIMQSYGASYTNIGASASTAGIKIGEGGIDGYISVNTFTNLVLNNATSASTNPGGGCTNGRGFWAESPQFACNAISGIDCSFCGWGIYLDYTSTQNTWTNYWAENNIQRNVEYTLRVGANQVDTWIERYYGGGTYTPAADINPINSANVNQAYIRLDYGIITTRLINGIGFNFPSTQVPVGNPNTLDDYSEGLWTPLPTRNAGGFVGTYSNVVGIYTKIGRQVYVYGKFTIDTITTASSGANIIQGLPYPAGTNPDTGHPGGGLGVVATDSALTSNVKAARMTSNIGLYLIDTAGAEINEAWVAGGTIEVSCTYLATT